MYHDIRKVSPSGDDAFFVDTNVWYWCTYVASKSFIAKRPKDYQIENYPEFIESALNCGAKLYYSPLSLVELAGLIERSELAIFNAYHNDQETQLKRFRSIPKERGLVLAEIKTAWASIQSMANELPVTFKDDLSKNLMGTLESHGVDGYDAIYYQLMKEGDISKIITDDKDFRGIDHISLYSCYERD